MCKWRTEKCRISLNTCGLKSEATLTLLRKLLHVLFYIYLLHSVGLYLALWPLTLPLQPRCKPSLLSDSQLCCAPTVKPFDHRTKALPGFKECCLGGKQGWRRSCGSLILRWVSCDWRAKEFLSIGSFHHPHLPWVSWVSRDVVMLTFAHQKVP